MTNPMEKTLNYQPVMSKPMLIIDYNLIDESIRDLIYYLNTNGVRTKWCCSGHSNFNYTWDNWDREHYKKLFEKDILDEYITYGSYITFRLKKHAQNIFNKIRPIENCFIFLDDNQMQIWFNKKMSDDDISNVWKNILKQIKINEVKNDHK